jgi:serine/threonine-protein kinase HipA
VKRCPVTYEEITEGLYSRRGLHLLSRKLGGLNPLPYTAEEQRIEAARRAGKMSIQGVQPKLSARLNVASRALEVVDSHGRYILKPPSEIYPELPQNEDLTMRLASFVGIEVPLHGMVYARDGSLTYFVRRFDRIGHHAKLALEDFAQLQGKTRETKYNSSMERVAETIQQYCTFPVIEHAKLFRLVIVNYLVGNEDMHLKNFSLIRRGNMVALSPAYDLLSTSIAMGRAPEEIALPLHGKKKNLTRTDIVTYFGIERLGLQQKVIDQTINAIAGARDRWFATIDISFLSDRMKDEYTRLLISRFNTLNI